MIKIKRLVFNNFQVNTYILYNDKGNCIIIDPGCSNDSENKTLSDFISCNNLKPSRLLLTHGHIDHILGASFVIKQYDLPLEVHKEDLHMIELSPAYAGNFGLTINIPKRIEASLAEGDTIKFDDSEIKIIHIPGHSPGSVAFYSAEEKFIIVGDVLFKGSIGRTDLPGGNYDVLMESIGTKLMTLNEDTTVFSGHMGETTIGIEKRSNPFITDYFGTY